MKNMILVTLLTLSVAPSFAATAIYTCGELAISDNCDVDVCRVSLQTGTAEKPFYITVGELNGTSLRHDYGVDSLGLFELEGQEICVAGNVLGGEFIPQATIVEDTGLKL